MILMLCEQAVTSICTLIFAANSLYRTVTGDHESDWNSISPEAAIVLRTLMFCVMLYSTMHLSASIRAVVEKEQNE